MIGDPAYIAGADSLPSENGIYQFTFGFFDSEALDQIVAGTGLYEADSCAIKIFNTIDDGVHCAVSTEDDQVAVFTPGGEFRADLFYGIVGR